MSGGDRRAALALWLIACAGAAPDDDVVDSDTPADELVGILVQPERIVLPVGGEVHLRATGLAADRTARDVTAAVTWRVQAEGVVAVDDGLDREGVLSAVSVGLTTVTAALGQVVSPGVSVEVTEASVLGLRVAPAALTLSPGQVGQLTATAAYSDGRSADASGQVRWIVEDPDVATVDATGRVTARGRGATAIGARSGDVGAEPITVTVTEGRSDLVVESVRPAGGDVVVVVANTGDVAASDFWVDVFIDPARAPVVDDLGDDFARVGLVGPGATATLTFPLGLAGQRVVTAFVDTNDDVDEAREDNNTRTETASYGGVAAAPDVGVVAVDWLVDEVSAYAFVTLVNYGDAPSGAFDLAIYEDLASPPGPRALADVVVRVPSIAPYGEAEVDVLWDPGCAVCDVWLWADPQDTLGDADPSDNLAGPYVVALDVVETGGDTAWW